jgi:uncharacterized membrane protein YphA (DoxX/SURF4 family)
MEKYAPLAGRILLSLIFILSGAGKIFDWDGTAGYMSAHGMPLVPLFLIGTIVFELGGGFSVLFGYKAKWGSLLLILFLIPTTFIFHSFWGMTDPMMQKMQMVMFLKNFSIMGGLFLVYSFGSGPFSIGENEA